MASITPDDGRDWIANKLFNNESDEYPYIVAVGDGTTLPASDDSSLGNEIYRANDDDSNCTVELTGNTGQYLGRITVSGGTEVPANSDISEIGLFSSDGTTLLYRETRNAVTISSGDRKTFEFTNTIITE